LGDYRETAQRWIRYWHQYGKLVIDWQSAAPQ
jgi:hypothetical protein